MSASASTSASTSTPRRRSTTEKLSRRKRTIIACQFCRLRKTRCDGVRPVCGFCQHHDAQCVWSGQEGTLESTPVEREILQHLGDIKELLKSTDSLPSSVANPPDIDNPHHTGPASPTTVASHPSNLPSVSPSQPSYASTRCESLLRWPIFQGFIEPSDAAIESFVLESCPEPESNQHTHFTQQSAPQKMKTMGMGIQEDHFIPLCRKFLAHVHPWNPILEGGELIQYAKYAAENGLEWDGPSCLVLIACALASYTSPWTSSTSDWPEVSHGLQDTDVGAAEAYYMAAKKRIGLLGSSLVDIQCLFFASIYEKYAFGSLAAWLFIQQASSRLQAHLKQHRRLHMRQGNLNENVSDHQLQQRVFWSVFKAENELLAELPFKSSGIEDLIRSDSMFPCPPTFPTQSQSIEPSSPDELNSWQEETSWFFYLAEIALRRTINDTLWLLYRKGEFYWMTHISALEQQYGESERQISLWYNHLPDSIRFKELEQPQNELSFYLQGRLYEWRDYLLRPFLYYVLHRSRNQVLTPRILSCAQDCVLACASGIPYYERHHRHGGTWFVCRRIFTFTMTILAVIIKADHDLPSPPNWDSLVPKAITTLRRWESQCADVRAMRLILEKLFDAVRGKLGMVS